MEWQNWPNYVQIFKTSKYSGNKAKNQNKHKLFSQSLSDHTVKNVVNILLSDIATTKEFSVDILKMAEKSFDLVN